MISQKARYINNLMTTASVRVKEKDRIYEKKLLKERKLEDEEYGDKPKFMTTAYKNKLMESQKWEMEDK
jgi:coiled-coil domain-containing protein 55